MSDQAKGFLQATMLCMILAATVLYAAWQNSEVLIWRWMTWRADVVEIPDPPDYRDYVPDDFGTPPGRRRTRGMIDLYYRIDGLVDYAQHMRAALQAAAEIMSKVDGLGDDKNDQQGDAADGSEEEEPEEQAAVDEDIDPKLLPPLEPEPVLEAEQDQQPSSEGIATEAKAGRWPYNEERALILFYRPGVDEAAKESADRAYAAGEPFWVVNVTTDLGRKRAEEFGVEELPTVVEIVRGEVKSRTKQSPCPDGTCPLR